MDVLGDIVGDVVPDALAEDIGGSFAFPDNMVLRYRWEDAVVTSSPDTDSITNSGNYGTATISQGMASAKPHKGADFVDFDEAAGNRLHGSGFGTVLPAGSYITMFLVARLKSFTPNDFLAAFSNGSSGGSYFRIIAGTSMDTPFQADVGGVQQYLVPSAAFSDTTDFHVFRASLYPAGATMAIDGVEGTPVVQANDGLIGEISSATQGSRVTPVGAYGDFQMRDHILLGGATAPTSSEISSVENWLLENRV